MKILRDESGQTTMIMAACMTCLFSMAGFSTDAGMMFRAKRAAQTAADSAAFAGAAELNYADVSSSAKGVATMNGFTNGSGGATVTVNNPPLSGPHTGNSGYVEVIVSKSEPTYFMRLLNINTMTVSARSVAGVAPSSACVYTLGTSGTDIGVSGSGALNLSNCGILVNSSSSSAVTVSGSASVTATSIGIVGGYSGSGSSSLNPTPITGVAPSSNPLGFIPAPAFTTSSCLANPSIHNGTATLGPTIAGGTVCYNGITATGGTITLQPGVYVINGDLRVTGSSSFSGTGVTIYLAPSSSSMTLTGSGAMNLTAPTSGTYDGILFFEDPADTQTMSVTGSGGSTMSGIFYAPSASLSLTGSGSSTFNADLVVKGLSISGSGNLSSYSAVNSTSPLTTAVMAE